MEKFIQYAFNFGVVVIFILFVNGIVYTVYPPYRGYIQSWNQDVNREVFQTSKPFVAGTIQELRRYKIDYDTAQDAATKSAILAGAREIASEIDHTKLPEDIYQWLSNY